MNLFLIVRQALGLKQGQMAALLGVHHSLYRMAEKNQRNLTPSALDRLVWMWKTVEALPPTNLPPYKRNHLLPVLNKIQKKKMKTDQLVEENGDKWMQMQNLLAFQPLFLQQFPAESHPAETGTLAGLCYEAQYFTQSSNREEQLYNAALQVGLTAMMEFLESESKKNL